jgi:hypothetical protein
MTTTDHSRPSDSPPAQHHVPSLPEPSGEYAPCPVCGTRDAKQVGFTWWGGLIGASMLHHVKCQSCKMQYNGKTGRSNAAGIAVYVIVSTAIFLALFLALRNLP